MLESQDVLILGVDGGGSKTSAWIAKLSRPADSGFPFTSASIEIVGRGESGPSNPRSVGLEIATKHVATAVAAARFNAKLEATPFASACLSMAGVGRDEDRAEVRQWAENFKLANRIIVINDVEPLYLAAEYEQPTIDWSRSIVLVIGTGSIASGRNGDQPAVRIGGWGYLLGDEGSGFSIGMAALRMVCRHHDDGIPLSAFHQRLLKTLELREPPELVGFIYQNNLPRERVAAASRIVFEDYEADDQAKLIVDNAITSMADLVFRSAKRLDFTSQDYALALSGGVLTGNSFIAARLAAELRRRNCEPSHIHLISNPVYGPLMTAVSGLSIAKAR